MRRIEEKIMIITEIISMFFIIIGSIVLQLVESRIDIYDNEKIILEIKRSEYLQLASYHSQKINFYELTGVLGQLGEPLRKEAYWTEDPVAKAEDVDGNVKEIMNKYKNGEITAYQFATEMGNYHREKIEHYKLRVRQAGDEIKRLIKNPPVLYRINIFFLKRLCIIFQLVGACVAIILFLILLRAINKRIVN